MCSKSRARNIIVYPQITIIIQIYKVKPAHQNRQNPTPSKEKKDVSLDFLFRS